MALAFFSPITSIASYTMFSAMDFLPLFITMLMKRAMVSLPCLGSGRTERWGVLPLRDMSYSSGLRTLGAVLGARLATLGNAGGVERTADGVVTHTRQILHATAADQDHGVLLQVMAFATDVADDLFLVRQAHFGDLTQGRVRLLRGGGVHARADATALRALVECRRGTLVGGRLPRLAYQLVDRRHQ